jgi:hypothetical protein
MEEMRGLKDMEMRRLCPAQNGCAKIKKRNARSPTLRRKKNRIFRNQAQRLLNWKRLRAPG